MVAWCSADHVLSVIVVVNVEEVVTTWNKRSCAINACDIVIPNVILMDIVH